MCTTTHLGKVSELVCAGGGRRRARLGGSVDTYQDAQHTLALSMVLCNCAARFMDQPTCDEQSFWGRPETPTEEGLWALSPLTTQMKRINFF
jgi:hypothetical protein